MASRIPTLPSFSSTYNTKLTNVYSICNKKNAKKNKLNINTKTFAEQWNGTELCLHFTKTKYKKDEVIT